jgi:hypothetical protein
LADCGPRGSGHRIVDHLAVCAGDLFDVGAERREEFCRRNDNGVHQAYWLPLALAVIGIFVALSLDDGKLTQVNA